MVSTANEFATFLTHPVKILHVTWIPAAPLEVTVTQNLTELYYSSMGTKLLNKFGSLWYFRGNIKISVVVQGQTQAYGQMALVFSPKCLGRMTSSSNVSISNSQFHNFRILPHISLDPAKSCTYDLTLPVSSPTGWYDNASVPSAMRHGSYCFEQFIINPLRSGTAASPSVNICVYMSIENPEFHAVTTLLSSEFRTEKDPLKLSNVAKSVASFSSKMAMFSGAFSPAVTLFSNVSSTVGEVLAFFGFSKPPLHDISSFVLNRTCDNYSQSEGTSTAIVLGRSQKQPISLSPSFGLSDYEHMSIDYICSRPGLVACDMLITTAMTSDAFLFSIPVSPALWFLYSGRYAAIPLAGLARAHAYWCGDLTFHVQIMASVFQRCTILVAWDPFAVSNVAPTFTNALNLLMNTTVQVSGNTNLDIDVPYKSVMPALRTGAATGVNSTVVREAANGQMYFYLVNPVVSNGSTDPIAINVFVSSKNMAFLCPETDINVANTVYNDATFLLSADFETQLELSTSVVSFGPRTNLDDIQLKLTGDRSRSVKDLISRMSVCYAGTAIYSGTGGVNTWTLPLSNTPLIKHDPNFINSLLGYITPAFYTARGSIAWSAKILDTYVDETRTYDGELRVRVSSTNICNLASGTIVQNAYGVGTSVSNYAMSEPNMRVSSRADFIAPMTITNDFVLARTNHDVFTSPNSILITFFHPERSSVDSTRVEVMQGAGDDFVLSWFLGFPALPAG